MTTVSFLRSARGTRHGRACRPVRPRRRGHAPAGARCTAWVAFGGQLIHRDAAGVNRLALQSGIGSGRFPPGSYELVATARLAGFTSQPATARFSVAKP